MNLNQLPIYRKNINNKRISTVLKTKSKFIISNKRSDRSRSSRTLWNKNGTRGKNSSTLHSATTSTTYDDSDSRRIITAVTEGRGDAKCEVGIASIDISHPNLILCQISDMQNYINTLTKINILNPSEIIVPITFADRDDNSLIDKIKKRFPNVKIINVPRRTFNKDNGMELVSELCLPSINTICVGLQHRYYALAAASGLIAYLQHSLNIYYTSQSINVYYQESEGCALIDVSTADRLELVSCTRPAQANRYSTLFGVLNHCFTKIGSRVLRSTILQPPFLVSQIEERLNCITELVKRPEMLISIQEILQKITNIDQILSITSLGLHTTQIGSNKQLNYLLLLNNILDFIDPLKDILDECQQSFLRELRTILSSEAVDEIKKLVRTFIYTSAHPGKGGEAINQRCFAIKPGINGLLDLVRKTYSERLDDMKNYVEKLGGKYGLKFSLVSNNVKGYHIVLKLNQQEKKFMKKSDLPAEFIQVCRLSGSFTMKTEELINYSTRLDDIMTEILKISNVMINKTIVDLKQYIGFFYVLCDSIAKLDVIQALSEVSLRNNYTRPQFGAFTQIAEAKHPLLHLSHTDRLVDNPIYISDEYNVHVITGPNGSGKSVYIRQVMLLQIMAQVGCYVPAASAIFRPADRMFARVYLEDSLEYGTSTFMLEMKEIKYMMTVITEKSLVIIDELCRSTALEEGVALAMAIVEKLSKNCAFLYITTHFTALAKLGKMYHNVKTWQMETIANGETVRELSLQYNYKLIPGVVKLKHYGLYLIQNMWPQAVTDEIYDILKTREDENEVNNARFSLDYNEDEASLMESNINQLPVYDDPHDSFSDYANSAIASSTRTLLEYPPVEVLLRSGSTLRSCLDISSNKSCTSIQNCTQTPGKIITNRNAPFIQGQDNNFNNGYRSPQQHDVSITSPDEPPVHFLVDVQIESLPLRVTRELDQDRANLQSGQNMETAPLEYSEENDEHSNTSESLGYSPLCSPSNSDDNLEARNSYDESVRNSSNCITAISSDSPKLVNNESKMSPSTKTSELLFIHKVATTDCLLDNQSPKLSVIKSNPEFSFQASELESSTNNIQSKCNSSSTNRSEIVQHRVGLNRKQLRKRHNSCDPASSSSNSVGKKQKNRFIPPFRKTSATNQSTSDNPFNANHDAEFTSQTSKLESLNNLQSKCNSTSTSLTEIVQSPALNRKEIRIRHKQSDPASSSSTSEGKKQLNRFIPPKKLTKREIEQEFSQQDRMLYETDVTEEAFNKYLNQVRNRPSIQQMQKCQHLAFMCKTKEGFEVIPTDPKPSKIGKIQKKPTAIGSSTGSNNNIDISIFSDRNAKTFEEFLNSEEKDIRKFNFAFSYKPDIAEQIGLDRESTDFNFAPSNTELAKFESSFQEPVMSLSQWTSQNTLVCDGYYKEHEASLVHIMNKYLKSPTMEFNSGGMPSVFETCASVDKLDLS